MVGALVLWLTLSWLALRSQLRTMVGTDQLEGASVGPAAFRCGSMGGSQSGPVAVKDHSWRGSVGGCQL